MQEQSLRDILNRGECFSIKMLDINGYDLIELGFKGIEIKMLLAYCLIMLCAELLKIVVIL